MAGWPDADQVVDELRALGARVEIRGKQIAVYPSDEELEPVIASARNFNLAGASAGHRGRMVNRLRRAGFELGKS